MRANNWNWNWNKKNRHSCIYWRTWKIFKEKNQSKCQNRICKLIVIPGVWRESMLRVYGCVFCSICLLSVYMCVRIPLCSRSIAGVPSRRALPHFPHHTTCMSYWMVLWEQPKKMEAWETLKKNLTWPNWRFVTKTFENKSDFRI